MALIACNECSHEVSTESSVCPKCGAEFPQSKWWLWVLWLVLVFIGLSFILGAANAPKDTIELAHMDTESCIKSHGDGEWRASLGISLELFCKSKGEMAGIQKSCEINPSKC